MFFYGTRYARTTAYLRDGVLTVDKRKPAKFNPKEATYYTFVEGDTVDGIAYREYGNAQLSWAILDANPQFLTEIEIKPGDELMIPSYEEVVKCL